MLWRKEAYRMSLWRCLWSKPVVAANGKPRPGSISEAGMTVTSVLVSQHILHMIGL